MRSARRAAAADETARAEAFRMLRSNLEISIGELDRPTIMVTSPNAGEGKTLTTVNLAAAVASAGRRVVLVDLDLRHPDVHTYLDAHNVRGVTDVLLGRMPLTDCLQFVEPSTQLRRLTRGFYVLPVGPSVDNPAELLSTARTMRLVEGLAREADVVLIDAPPVLPVADAVTLGRVVGGVVLVAEAHRTTYPQLERAIDLLTRNQARRLGVVLNKVRESLHYGYGYSVASSS